MSATRPLHGEKKKPLTAHAIAALVHLSGGPRPRQEMNPSVANRLLRGELVEGTFLPSPYKTHAGKRIEFLRLTKLGHETAMGSHKTPAELPSAPPAGSQVAPDVGRAEPKRTFKREPMPVRCEICQWRGRRLAPRSAPCPACGSRVEFA